MCSWLRRGFGGMCGKICGKELSPLNPTSMFWPLTAPGLAIGLLAWWRSVGLGHPIESGHPWLASGLEIRAFHKLEARFSRTEHLISAHMLLADVIGRQNLEQLSRDDRQFVWRAHCDFVIVRRESLKIERVVEINGGFHEESTQEAHDSRKREILGRVGIELEVWN